MNLAMTEGFSDLGIAIDVRVDRFRAMVASARVDADCRQVRAEAVRLLLDGGIAVGEYTALFGGHARHLLTRSPDGHFQHVIGKGDAREIARVYSRAKHGCRFSIGYLVKEMLADLLTRLDEPGSSIRATFEEARAHGHHVVLFGTGQRNVSAASNVMCEMFVEEANMVLVERGYPTIANVQLPRIAPPCENYAQLSLEERVQVSLVQDHILPDANFYAGNGVHVLFLDDVIVTGATADKVYASAMAHGARSFNAIYPVVIDPVVALQEPEVEDALNTCCVGAGIDDGVVEILANPDNAIVLRTLRLVFMQQHHSDFLELIRRVGHDRVRILFRLAYSADFCQHEKYARSLAAAREFLGDRP